jgi:hypothetical protein
MINQQGPLHRAVLGAGSEIGTAVASARARRSAPRGPRVRRLRTVGLMLTVVATAAAVVAFASPASADLPGNWLRNVGNGLCLQPVGGSFSQGAAIVQVTCDTNTTMQRWQSTYSSATVFQMRNVGTGLCLDARGGATNGTPIQQWTCNSISNEKWDLGPAFVTVRSRVSGTQSHCLDAPQGSGQVGLAMQLYRCNGTPAQTWDLWGPGGIIH